MGQICTLCYLSGEESRSTYPYHKITQLPTSQKGSEKSSVTRTTSARVFNFLDVQKRLLGSSYIDHVAIVDLQSGNILCSDFKCNKEGIRHVVRAFKGRQRFLHEDGIILGSNIPNYVIESVEDGQVINGILQDEALRIRVRYGSASLTGGCSISRTLSALIIITYSGQGDMAKAILRQVVKDVMSDGF